MTPDDSFRVIRFGQTADQNKTALLKEKEIHPQLHAKRFTSSKACLCVRAAVLYEMLNFLNCDNNCDGHVFISFVFLQSHRFIICFIPFTG